MNLVTREVKELLDSLEYAGIFKNSLYNSEDFGECLSRTLPPDVSISTLQQTLDYWVQTSSPTVSSGTKCFGFIGPSGGIMWYDYKGSEIGYIDEDVIEYERVLERDKPKVMSEILLNQLSPETK